MYCTERPAAAFAGGSVAIANEAAHASINEARTGGDRVMGFLVAGSCWRDGRDVATRLGAVNAATPFGR